tara:strand:- start:2130 stop:2570 length:441 start_codon:yes stop_codon:yes gene_type:complete
MINITVTNEITGAVKKYQQPDQEAADAMIDKFIARDLWGKPERYMKTSELPEELQSRVLSTREVELGEESYEESLVKSDYVIEQEDLTQNAEYQAAQVLRRRAVEYSKIDSMLLEALAEKEAGRPEKMDEYLALREQIRLDHPKAE